jgi:DNA-3-methyladenine glycosylase
MKLSTEFYRQDDVTAVAKQLIGMVICTQIDGVLTSGIITETEAYAGITDRASHAFGGRRTKRNEVMYGGPGVAYVYLCYGIHHLFNVVTNAESVPHAVLLRAIKPLEGESVMLQRRGLQKSGSRFTGGPGTASAALGIKTSMNGIPLSGDKIWIEDRGLQVPEHQILATPRIGVAFAGEDALLPYRFNG